MGSRLGRSAVVPREVDRRGSVAGVLGLWWRRRVAGLAVAATGVAGAVVVLPSPAVAAGSECGPDVNPVACENAKPGADPDEWDIWGAGDEGIQGFATDISVNVGGTIGFKIDTDASAYTIDIYRTGWYGGLGARKIDSVVPSVSLPQVQPACVSDVTTELYDCGNWAVSASWSVPSTAVSGVYIARLHDPLTDESSHITFVVRDDASRSDVVFQTSDTTWHAYNTYGGSSFYQGGANGRAYKVSYNRPFATRGVTARDFYFASEYPMVRFLERNGYDVTYQSGVDTDRYGSLLLNHEVFLSVGHDEYWSGAQRANVEAARDAGVDLAFFSGNEVYWRTRYEPAIAGAADPYRTLVSYKETWGNAKIDPSPEWTGTWRDPRFAPQSAGGGLPENGLTGTLYMSNDSDLPVTVSAEEGKLRLWRNTSLASLAAGTTAALAPHTVGYESNEDLDNGFRPAGLIHLSTTTGAVPQYLQDFGNTVQAGLTTHHTTLYRAASGALVFSAGSIQWSWGLDQTHDGDGAPADPRMQQATVNLLADMGVQPGSLMSGLAAATASSDTTAPTVTITSPAAGAQLANGTTVTVTGTASDTGGGRVAGVEVSTDGGATWHPATGTTTWTYTYIQTGQGTTPLLARAVDDSANVPTAPTSIDLTVSCPCSIFGSTVPATPAADDSGAVELGLRFTPTIDGFVTGVRFYKGTGNTGTHTGTLWSSTAQALATVTFTDETAEGWQTAGFATPVGVAAGITYVVSYTAPAGLYAVAIEGLAYGDVNAPPLRAQGGYPDPGGVFGPPGNFPQDSYGAPQYFVDAVFDTVDASPMTLSGRQPLEGATSVSVASTVSAVLSRPAQVDTPSMSVTAAGGGSVIGSTTYDAGTRRLTFTPSAALARSTVYTAQVSALDLDGGGIAGPSSWSFTTAAAAQLPGGPAVSLYDEDDVPNLLEVADPGPVSLGVRFASSVDGTVDGIRFYKGPGNTGTHVGTLWRVSDTQSLGTVTFVDESTTGWQTAMFATPIEILKDTEYVASYRAPVGRYSATLSAFSGLGVQREPLRTAPDSGAFTYGDSFPVGTSSTSYYVDVVFRPVAEPLGVVAQTPAPGALGVRTDGAVSLTVSGPFADGATLALAAGAGPVDGALVLSADRRTLTFTPANDLAFAMTFTATASGLVSAQGAPLADLSWSFTTVSVQGCPCSLFGTEVPGIGAVTEGSAVELGVAFTPSVDGSVTGVRFYKGSGNGGTHTGTVWSSAGSALGTVTFTGETATGWQTAMFTTPIAVTSGATYVVSYLAPQGHYAATPGYFAADHAAGPLTSPAAGNGRFRDGGGFPTSTWNQTNYFVDVVFEPSSTQPVDPSVVSTSPPRGATGVATSTSVSAVLSATPAVGEPVLALATSAGPVAGSSRYDAVSRTVTFTPSAPLPGGASVSSSVTSGGLGLTGGTWSFTTALPSVVSTSPSQGASAVEPSASVSAVLSDVPEVAPTVALSTPAGPVAGTSAYAAATRTVTFTPSAPLPAGVMVSASVMSGGSSLTGGAWSFTTRAADAPRSDVEQYIDRVYRDLFDRAVDPTGLRTWTAALESGTPRVAVANAITSSTEYRTGLVSESYVRYLGRPAEAAGLAFWLHEMVAGRTITDMEAGFLASDEYFRNAGSGDAEWVRRLYDHVLGRSASVSEVDFWVERARLSGRFGVAQGFLLSTEHLTTVVDGYYQDLLGRGIDPSGRSTWVGQLQRGVRLEAVIGSIIASDEYYAMR